MRGGWPSCRPRPNAKPEDRPSIIIVEFLGFGGSEGDDNRDASRRSPRKDDKQSYDPDAPVQIVGRRGRGAIFRSVSVACCGAGAARSASACTPPISSQLRGEATAVGSG
jgi:hypothetical protein